MLTVSPNGLFVFLSSSPTTVPLSMASEHPVPRNGLFFKAMLNCTVLDRLLANQLPASEAYKALATPADSKLYPACISKDCSTIVDLDAWEQMRMAVAWAMRMALSLPC
ncbi:hypothetical protein ABPG75_000881 [Micractinium tetrahymenae]